MAQTIADLATEMERALDELRIARSLPEGWEGLRHLVPPNTHPRVTLHYSQPHRKIRDDASAEYFDPSNCEVRISFESIEDDADEVDATAPGSRMSSRPGSEACRELIAALDKAERLQDERGGFVGLKWFRDHFLPATGYSWADDPRTCSRVLHQATDSSLILKSQAPNPKNPLHPVSAIRLNRSHPALRRGEATEQRRRRFRPVRIRGEALSHTVLDARR